MNELMTFKNNEFGEIRTVTINNEPYFVGKDVAEVLGYSETAAMTRRLDKEDFIPAKLAGMNMKSIIINESGLYNAIFGSKLSSAKRFKKWVTADVLPTIRKHGMYATEELLNNPDLAIQTFQALKDERTKNKELSMEVARKNQLIGELKPKADYVDTILNNRGLVTITQIAKDYGMSGKRMNAILKKLGVQYKQSEQWLLYSKYHNCGYTHSKTIDITRSDGRKDVVLETKWTQKGRMFIYELLKKNGIYPVIEQEKIA